MRSVKQDKVILVRSVQVGDSNISSRAGRASLATSLTGGGIKAPCFIGATWFFGGATPNPEPINA